MPQITGGPKGLNELLHGAYKGALGSGDKGKASRIAWGAAKKAGWNKNPKGKWVKKHDTGEDYDEYTDGLELPDEIEMYTEDDGIEEFSTDEPTDWITVNGQHIPIGKGQSKADAIKERLGKGKESGGKKATAAEGMSDDALKAQLDSPSLTEKGRTEITAELKKRGKEIKKTPTDSADEKAPRAKKDVDVLHGTTDKHLKSILANGLIAGKVDNFRENFKTHSEGKVFVTKGENEAWFFADNAVEEKGGKPVVLKIRIPKNVWNTEAVADMEMDSKMEAAVSGVKKEWIVGAYRVDNKGKKIKIFEGKLMEEDVIEAYLPTSTSCCPDEWLMRGAEVAEFAAIRTCDIPDVEIFKVGTWNKDKYSLLNLGQMVANFIKLKGKVKPFIKLGHDNKQGFAGNPDGKPAFGWIDNLRVKGDTLIANFTDVPLKLADLIRSRAYRRVSSEIFPTYESNGERYEQVLRAVALLGGDVPAVDTLADIPAVFIDKTCQSEKYHVYSLAIEDFALIKRTKITNNKEIRMAKMFKIKKSYETIADFTKDIATQVMTKLGIKEDSTGVFSAFTDLLGGELEEFAFPSKDDAETPEEKKARLAKEKADAAKNASLEAQVKTLEADLAATKGELKTYMDKAKASEDTVSKMTLKAKEQDITAFVEKLKTEGKIFSKQEDSVKAILMRCDTAKVVKTFKKEDGTDVNETELDQTKAHFYSLPKIAMFAEIGKDGELVFKTHTTDAHGKVYEIADAEIDAKAKAYSKEHNVSYEKALLEVSKAK